MKSDLLRICPQMGIGGVLFFIVLWSMIHRLTLTDVIVLPFTIALFGGGILALLRWPHANWLLLFGSSGPLALGLFLHYLRIQFIIQNGGMEAPDGYGSPLAFLIGWMIPTVLIFLPGLVFFIWNYQKIRENFKTRLEAPTEKFVQTEIPR